MHFRFQDLVSAGCFGGQRVGVVVVAHSNASVDKSLRVKSVRPICFPPGIVPATIIGGGLAKGLAAMNPAGTDVVLEPWQTVASHGMWPC